MVSAKSGSELTPFSDFSPSRYVNQNNFLRSVKNFKMDITQTRWDAYVCAIHWQVAQGTSLENIEMHMSFDENTTQQVSSAAGLRYTSSLLSSITDVLPRAYIWKTVAEAS